MNKTLTMVAVVLGLLTAFIIADNTNDSDGYGTSGTEYFYILDGLKYWSICESDTFSLSKKTLLSENIYIEDGPIKKNMFLNRTGIKRVACSPSVTSVGERAFEGCTDLIRVSITGVKTIGDYAFMNSSVSEVITGSNLTTVGAYAFANCKNLSVSVLADTKVKTLETGTFYNAKMLAEDIRKVETIDETAFLDADIKFLAMRTGQIPYNDTPTRIFDDENLFKKLTYVSEGGREGVKFRVSDYAVMDPHGLDGEPIPAAFLTEPYKSIVYTYSKIFLSEGQDCIISTGNLTVRFQESLGIPDESVKTGTAYTLPDAPELGDLEFLGWTIPGIEDYVTSLTPETVAGLWPLVEPQASYTASTVFFDHSQLDAPLASALPVSMKFTFGSTYPVPGNLGNMGFACWIVDGELFEGGDEITTFTEHTARSVWAEEGMFSLTIHDCSAEVYSVMEILCTSTVELDSIVFEEPSDRMLIGWSLTDGGDRIRTETLRLTSDTDIYPVTKNRTKYTVTYKDGFSTIGVQTFYEGRPSAVDIELPVKPGMRFVRWMSEGVEYRMGDILEADRNMTFYSEWETVPEYRVSYEVEPRYETSVSGGSEIRIGAENRPPSHKYLSGWMETGISERVYGDGEPFIVNRNVSFTPIWSDCPQYKIVFHHHDGRVTEVSAYSDEDVVLGAPDPRIGFSFSGWSIRENGASDYRPDDTVRLQGDMDLFENWIENGTFVVTVHDGMTTPHVAYLGETVQLTLPDIAREGYVLLGWVTDENSDVPEYGPLQTLVLADTADLYPIWERLMALTYHDGDTVRTEYHGKDSVVELAVPIRDGFTFEGWSYEPEGVPECVGQLKLSDDVDLYAVWTNVMTADPGEGPGEPDTGDGDQDGTRIREGIGALECAAAAVTAVITALAAYLLRRN